MYDTQGRLRRKQDCRLPHVTREEDVMLDKFVVMSGLDRQERRVTIQRVLQKDILCQRKK